MYQIMKNLILFVSWCVEVDLGNNLFLCLSYT